MRPRPPHYLGFWRVVVSFGAYFALVWGIGMWLLMWREQGMAVGLACLFAVIAGSLFGVIMAYAYGVARRKWGLSRWEDL